VQSIRAYRLSNEVNPVTNFEASFGPHTTLPSSIGSMTINTSSISPEVSVILTYDSSTQPSSYTFDISYSYTDQEGNNFAFTTEVVDVVFTNSDQVENGK